MSYLGESDTLVILWRNVTSGIGRCKRLVRKLRFIYVLICEQSYTFYNPDTWSSKHLFGLHCAAKIQWSLSYNFENTGCCRYKKITLTKKL